jgi:hypothetical protein
MNRRIAAGDGTEARWALRRRDLLKQLGVGAACLPLLRPARAAGAPDDRRFICVVHPGGYDQAVWQPPGGPLNTLPATAASLDPHRSEVVFLPELANPNHVGYEEGAYGTACYGLPARTTGLFPEPRGKSVDQVIAGVLPGGRASTLALAVQTDVPPVAQAVGARRCFWAGEGQPVNPEHDPLLVYQRLFAGLPTPTLDPAIRRSLIERKSLLDYIARNVERWRQRLGTADRLIAEAHLQALRTVELQLMTVVQAPASCAPQTPAALDLAARGMFPKLMEAQLGLAVAAASCGLARVVTVQLSNASGANVDFGAFVQGIPARGYGFKSPYRNWADLTASPTMGGVNHKRIVDRWVVDRFALLLAQLKALPALGGTLLDASVVLWGSHMYDGSVAGRQKMSWMLAGSCGGYFRTGQCLVGGTASSGVSGVLADVCKAMGVPGAPFGPLYAGLARV